MPVPFLGSGGFGAGSGSGSTITGTAGAKVTYSHFYVTMVTKIMCIKKQVAPNMYITGEQICTRTQCQKIKCYAMAQETKKVQNKTSVIFNLMAYTANHNRPVSQ